METKIDFSELDFSEITVKEIDAREIKPFAYCPQLKKMSLFRRLLNTLKRIK